jgi:hypothetical protein
MISVSGTGKKIDFSDKPRNDSTRSTLRRAPGFAKATPGKQGERVKNETLKLVQGDN